VQEREPAAHVQAVLERADAAELEAAKAGEPAGIEPLEHRGVVASEGDLAADREHVLAAAVAARPGRPELLELRRRGRELVVADHLLEREVHDAAAGGPQVTVAAVAGDAGAEPGQEVAALVVGDGRRRPGGHREYVDPFDPDRFVDVPVSV